MSVNLTESDIQKIVQSVMENVERSIGESPHQQEKGDSVPLKLKAVSKDKVSSPLKMPSSENGLGVFLNMDDAIQSGHLAQQDFIKNYQVKDRERMISAIRDRVMKEKEELAAMVLSETKIGKYQDKLSKIELVASKTPGTENLKTEAYSGDDGLTIVEEAPFGLIGAVTPVTNPTETVLNNALSMLAAGNAVVFNVHPSSKKSCGFIVNLINTSLQDAGGPDHLVTMVKDPSLDTLQTMVDSPLIKLLVGTGGPGMVKELLRSGKKAIGAGAGNPPVIVDDSADLKNAAKSIIQGASFDNNLLCIAEKEVFVLETVADDLVYHLLNQGAYMLNHNQLNKVMEFALEVNDQNLAQGCSLNANRDYHVSKQWVGQDTQKFLQQLGVQTEQEVPLLICEVDEDHPFVQLEQMMPILPIVRVHSINEAIDMAVKAEHGNRHTAIMHSKNIDHLTAFAKAIETTIFVKNASSLAGVGFGGEGYTTMTIAGPTGEGITSARTFTRQRRCVLAEGGFRIIG